MGIEREGDLRFQYNAMTERESRLGIQFYETPFRSYDAQLGRFHQVDLLAGLYTGISPYNYALNNPISFNDPTGLFSNDPSTASGDDDIKWTQTGTEVVLSASRGKAKDLFASYVGFWQAQWMAGTLGGGDRGSSEMGNTGGGGGGTGFDPTVANTTKNYGGEGEKVRRFGDGLVKKHDVECPICGLEIYDDDQHTGSVECVAKTVIQSITDNETGKLLGSTLVLLSKLRLPRVPKSVPKLKPIKPTIKPKITLPSPVKPTSVKKNLTTKEIKTWMRDNNTPEHSIDGNISAIDDLADAEIVRLERGTIIWRWCTVDEVFNPVISQKLAKLGLGSSYFMPTNQPVTSVFGSGNGRILKQFIVIEATEVLKSKATGRGGQQYFSPKLFNNSVMQ